MARLLVRGSEKTHGHPADKAAIANHSEEMINFITALVWQQLHPKREITSGELKSRESLGQ
ncbi:hypothetical protein HB364_13635 [Pseudoflavitalea sp. X16]|uniref:hypothetical protein n=1 Tax=Paraflavitalea devenefica TaxID=2716334 RepID=UPI001421AD42|nr:hypothetical protein [Paraflavitalea devenefica]NII26130.1 hypothetical protein [Paraflavitalea devenefica]